MKNASRPLARRGLASAARPHLHAHVPAIMKNASRSLARRGLASAARPHLHARVPAVVAEFRVPEFMDDYDVLSRGSCFPVLFGGRTRWLCSRHVTHPHMHADDYFSANRAGSDLSWLREVRDEHIRLRLEWRSPGGDHAVERVVDESTSVDGRRVTSRPHADLDVAELIVPPQLMVPTTGADDDVLASPAFTLGASVAERDAVHLVGHNLCVEGASDELQGRMVPNQEDGRIELVSGFRMIVSTGETVLQMGMCGGAVCTTRRRSDAVVPEDDKAEEDEDGVVVCGMIEGILPAGTASGRNVADTYPEHACVLSAEKLSEFLSMM